MIYVVRRGETNYNVDVRYEWRIDTPLNENGIMQARKLKEIFKEIKFDVVITSPLVRAIETANEITDIEMITDERIIERSNGESESKLKSEITEDIDFNNQNEKKYNIESIVDFRKRIYNFLDEIKERYKGKNVLVVTHACVGIYIRTYFEGEPKSGNYYDYKLGNEKHLKYKN